MTSIHPNLSVLSLPPDQKPAEIRSLIARHLVMCQGDTEHYASEVRQGFNLLTDWLDLPDVLISLAKAGNQHAIVWLIEHGAAVLNADEHNYEKSWARLWDRVFTEFSLSPISPHATMAIQSMVCASLKVGLPFPSQSRLHLSPIKRAAQIFALCLLPPPVSCAAFPQILPPTKIAALREWILEGLENLPYPFASAHHSIASMPLQSHRSNRSRYVDRWGSFEISNVSEVAWALDGATAISLKSLTSRLDGMAVPADQADIFRDRLTAWPTANQALSSTVGLLKVWPDQFSAKKVAILDPSSIDEMIFPCLDPRELGRRINSNDGVRAAVRAWLLKEHLNLNEKACPRAPVPVFLLCNGMAPERNALIRYVLPVLGLKPLPSPQSYTVSHVILSWFPSPYVAALTSTAFGGSALLVPDGEGKTPLDYARMSLEDSGACSSVAQTMAEIERRILIQAAAKTPKEKVQNYAPESVHQIRRPARLM